MANGRIIVIGGGFAGVKCAKTLRSQLNAKDWEIVVFSRENHMVFYPLLAEVAAASMNAKDMAAPLRQLLHGVKCRTEEVMNIELENNQLTFQDVDGSPKVMKYDHLVISSGNTTNLAFIPGMADHAMPLKSIADALKIQAHVIGQLENAEIADSPEKQKWFLSFVVVGGGFSGVEMAGELNDFVKSSAKFYSNFTAKDVEVILVHAHEQILPEVSPSLRDFARKKMEQDGVKFYLNSSATVCTADGVRLKDGRTVRAATKICTIGSRALPMIERLDVAKERGRLVVNPDMSIPGYQNAWAIGDCAAVKNTIDGELSPTTGQFAERQGAQVAKNIVHKIAGGETKPFSHQSLGTLCSIGGHNAVAEMFNFRISGFLAWFVWRGVYLMKLPSIGQQIKVAVTWAFDLLFPPQLTAVPVDSSNNVGSAHYTAGDLIFKSGDPATDFYVVENGEVEIISQANGHEETVAILGKGDFFGESALLERKSHTRSCRARADSEIMVVGKNVFGQISENLVPFKEALASITKRRTKLFQNFPEALECIQKFTLADFVDKIELEPVTKETPLIEVVSLMNDKRLDYVYVIGPENVLDGLVSRTDLLRWAEIAATHPAEQRLHLKVKDLVEAAPIAVSTHTDAIGAISIMRQRGLKRLPVVEEKTNVFVGIIRIENVMEKVLKQLV